MLNPPPPLKPALKPQSLNCAVMLPCFFFSKQ